MAPMSKRIKAHMQATYLLKGGRWSFTLTHTPNPAFNPDPLIRASFSVCSLLMLR